jgi:hypothetical protein
MAWIDEILTQQKKDFDSSRKKFTELEKMVR